MCTLCEVVLFKSGHRAEGERGELVRDEAEVGVEGGVELQVCDGERPKGGREEAED